MKLKDIAKGTRAIRRVMLPLVNVRCPLLPDLPELAEQRAADQAAFEAAQAGSAPSAAPAASVEVGLRVLTGEEAAEVYEKAAEFARARGSSDPKPGDPLYDFGEAIHRVALATVDPDSDPAHPSPFFASVDEMLSSPHVGRDGIIYLAEAQETWQDLCSPQLTKFSAGELFDQIGKAAAAGDESLRFFELLRPGARWILLRTLASLLLSSRQLKSQLGTHTSSTSESAPSESSDDDAS